VNVTAEFLCVLCYFLLKPFPNHHQKKI